MVRRPSEGGSSFVGRGVAWPRRDLPCRSVRPAQPADVLQGQGVPTSPEGRNELVAGADSREWDRVSGLFACCGCAPGSRQGRESVDRSEQINRAKRLVTAETAPSSIRARAIQITVSALIEDEEYVQIVLDRLADSSEALEVRQAASNAIQSQLMSIRFLRDEEDRIRTNIFSTYRSLLDADEQRLRRPMPIRQVRRRHLDHGLRLAT